MPKTKLFDLLFSLTVATSDEEGFHEEEIFSFRTRISELSFHFPKLNKEGSQWNQNRWELMLSIEGTSLELKKQHIVR